jgi:hypothetical protein
MRGVVGWGALKYTTRILTVIGPPLIFADSIMNGDSVPHSLLCATVIPTAGFTGGLVAGAACVELGPGAIGCAIAGGGFAAAAADRATK